MPPPTTATYCELAPDEVTAVAVVVFEFVREVRSELTAVGEIWRAETPLLPLRPPCAVRARTEDGDDPAMANARGRRWSSAPPAAPGRRSRLRPTKVGQRRGTLRHHGRLLHSATMIAGCPVRAHGIYSSSWRPLWFMGPGPARAHALAYPGSAPFVPEPNAVCVLDQLVPEGQVLHCHARADAGRRTLRVFRRETSSPSRSESRIHGGDRASRTRPGGLLGAIQPL